MNESNGTGTGYHWAHVHVRNKISPHFLDFHHYPPAFKPYGGGVSLDLGRPGESPAVHKSETDPFSLEGLAEVLFYAYGVISARQNGPVTFYRRTVPSAGGLYPCNLYVALDAQNRSDRQPQTDTTPETGLYYYDPVQSRLVQLRSPEHSGPDHGSGCRPERAVFFITAAFYNSTWKYRGRAYRYMLLDGGHLVRNLELVLGARGIDAHVSYAFPGDETAGLLAVDPSKEAVLACVHAGWNKSVPEIVTHLTDVTRPAETALPADPVHDRYLEEYAGLAAVHRKSLTGPVGDMDITVTETPPVASIRPDLEALSYPDRNRLDRLIVRRRSRRNFTSARLARNVYMGLFKWLGAGDEKAKPLHRFLRLGMVCQNLDGMADGFYLFNRTIDRISLVMPGTLAPGLARVCLDQAWIGRAAISFLCFACPDALETDLGAAGYRSMMLDAGRLGHQIYLGAEATGLGCCGVGAIYDFEAQSLLGLSSGTALVYALSVGPEAQNLNTTI